MKKFAFTLSEILITLTILGIVAAITISSINNYFQKQQTITGLKIAYSMLSELTRQSEAENGLMKNWDFTNTTRAFNTYFRPYLSITKDCGLETTSNENDKCFYSENGGWKDIFEIQPSSNIYVTARTYYKVVLKNGMSLGINAHKGDSYDKLVIVVDINGKRGDSITGKDIFFFTINQLEKYSWQRSQTEIVGELMTGQQERYINTKNSNSIYNNKGTILNDYCSKNSKVTSTFYIAGGLCARAIELNGWKIPSNYPFF